MLPVVAMIGRPNVGKSTLFNRLTHSRKALTSSHPGMTRDRQYGDVHIDQYHFIIIDTGGMIEDTEEKINELINKQGLQAINEADKIIFLIDGQCGITNDDYYIASLLRRIKKNIILTVNKTEGRNQPIAIADAFELGMGQPIPISALHGEGISDLLTILFSGTASTQPNEDKQSIGIKIAIAGRPNVGKSTLTNRMLGEERVIVDNTPGTTRDSIYIPLQRYDQFYTLIDTAGVRKRKKAAETPEKFSIVKTLQSIEDAHVVIYVIDARVGVSEQDLKLIGFILECGRGLILAINKWDGLSDEIKQHAKASLDRQLDFVNFARVHYISALHGSGVGNLFDSVNEAYTSATKPLSTPIVTKLLQKALLTHSPPLVKGRRIKLKYAHAGGHNPPKIIIHGNQLESLPESYRKFLAHFYQKHLKLYGTPVAVEFKSNKNPYKVGGSG